MKELIGYKYFLISNIKKNINEKYKGSVLGLLWTFINPLFLTLIYTLLFPIILKSKENNYTMFLVIGILSWNYFVRGVMEGTKSIVQNRDLLKKIYFPKIILPLTVAISELINFLITTSIIFIFLIIYRIPFSFKIIYLPIIIVLQLLLTFGISLITSTLNVFFRDTEYILDFVLHLLYYVTPVFYATNLLKGSRLEFILKLNPMTVVLDSYRDILLNRINPDFIELGWLGVLVFIFLVIGVLIFKKCEKKFVEEL